MALLRHWTSGELEEDTSLSKLINAISFLINKHLFTVCNLVFKQDIGKTMDFDPASFWTNLFPYFFESKYIKQFISLRSSKAYKYHRISRFINDLYDINDDKRFLAKGIRAQSWIRETCLVFRSWYQNSRWYFCG